MTASSSNAARTRMRSFGPRQTIRTFGYLAPLETESKPVQHTKVRRRSSATPVIRMDVQK